jgi:hypothetical protein
VKLSTDPPVIALLNVRKFYDKNCDGLKGDDANEPYLIGWEVRITDGIDLIRYTDVRIVVEPDTYIITEFDPIKTNWRHTTPVTIIKPLGAYDTTTVKFGNVCIGAGGGLTLGFWSNKNGAALIGAEDLAMLVSLNLRNANGSNFNPANYASFRTWLLGANATNMANMLSAQLAAVDCIE